MDKHETAEDRLITFEELSELVGVSYRSIMQARTQGRFALDTVHVSARNIRVRLSDARAVVRGERVLLRSNAMDAEARSRAKASNKKKVTP